MATQPGRLWLVKERIITVSLVTGALLLTTGCKSLFPSSASTVESRWQNYAAVDSAFEKIVPYQTDTNALKSLGFYPTVTPNVKILTYVDIIQIFIPNPGVRRKDLPAAVLDCIAAREQSWAYSVNLQNVNTRRHGSLFLDVFGFKRQTHVEGWSFKGLILIKKGVVVYKLASGEPRISRDEKQVKPLGPLQEIDGTILHIVSIPN